MTDVRLLPRDDDRDDFEYEDEHVELESELGEYGEDDGSEDNERPLADLRPKPTTMMTTSTKRTMPRR